MKKQIVALGALLMLAFTSLPSLAACPCRLHHHRHFVSPCCPAAPIASPCCPKVEPCCPKKVIMPCCPSPCARAIPCPCPAAPVEPCEPKPTYNDCSD